MFGSESTSLCLVKNKALFCILILKIQHLVGSVASPQCKSEDLEAWAWQPSSGLVSFFLFAFPYYLIPFPCLPLFAFVFGKLAVTDTGVAVLVLGKKTFS